MKNMNYPQLADFVPGTRVLLAQSGLAYDGPSLLTKAAQAANRRIQLGKRFWLVRVSAGDWSAQIKFRKDSSKTYWVDLKDLQLA